MNTTTNLMLPYLLPAQAQKHVTHNEALGLLDILVQLSVQDDQLSAPPQTPSEGDSYIVGQDSVGAWTGHDAEIAAFADGAWTFLTPKTGWRAWCAARETLLVFDGAFWGDMFAGRASSGTGTSSDAPSSLFGVNATPNETNRFALSSPAALFNHEGSDHRLSINKAQLTDTASIIFQTNFDAQGEIGLTGDNDISMKVRGANGTLKQALTLKNRSGYAGLGTSSPRVPFHIVSQSGPQLRVQPLGRAADTSSQPSLIDFWSTFDNLPADQAPRRTASIRASFDGGAWWNETLSVHVGGAFDAAGLPREQLRVTAAGRVGIGTQQPTAPLHVNGAVRVGSYTSANLPSASALGAGAIVFATNAPAGPGLVVSNGTSWISS